MFKITLEIDDQPWGAGEIYPASLISKKAMLAELIKIIPEDKHGTFVKVTVNDTNIHTIRKDLFDNLLSTNSFVKTAGEGTTATCCWRNLEVEAKIEHLYGHGRARLNLARVFQIKRGEIIFEEAKFTIGDYPHKMDYITFEALRVSSPSTYIKLIAPEVKNEIIPIQKDWRETVPGWRKMVS